MLNITKYYAFLAIYSLKYHISVQYHCKQFTVVYIFASIMISIFMAISWKIQHLVTKNDATAWFLKTSSIFYLYLALKRNANRVEQSFFQIFCFLLLFQLIQTKWYKIFSVDSCFSKYCIYKKSGNATLLGLKSTLKWYIWEVHCSYIKQAVLF